MQVMANSRLQTLTIFSLCLLIVCAQSIRSQTPPAPAELNEILFVYNDRTRDRDEDGLKDKLEFRLANHFKPRLIFDSEEKARASDEPKVLFQVRPEGCIGAGCRTPWKIWIAYSFLFAQDCGYGRASGCEPKPLIGYPGGAHAGDNDRLRIRLTSNDGIHWVPDRVENSHAQKFDKENFVWPIVPRPLSVPVKVNFHQGHYVDIYMSGSKHHQYFDTAYDGYNSPYSNVGCDEDVDGKGRPIVLPTLLSELPDNRPNNVGEGDHQSFEYFITDLGPFGFQGEYAWGGNFIDTGTEMQDLWMKHPFYFGDQFCTYIAPRILDTKYRVTVIFTGIERLDGNPLPPNANVSFRFKVGDQTLRYPATGTVDSFPVNLTNNNSVTLEFLCGQLGLHSEVILGSGTRVVGSKDDYFKESGAFGRGPRETILKVGLSGVNGSVGNTPDAHSGPDSFRIKYRVAVKAIQVIPDKRE